MIAYSAEAKQLGVGILYNPALPDFLRTHLQAVDYVSVIPDTFWYDQGVGAPDRFREIGGYVEFLDWLAPQVPLVVHGLSEAEVPRSLAFLRAASRGLEKQSHRVTPAG